MISDHFSVKAEIKVNHNPVDSHCNILYKYTHTINILAFNDDIVNTKLITNLKAEHYVNNTTLHFKPYKHLPDQNP